MEIEEELLFKVLTDVRIFACPQDGTTEEIERYLALSVPRVGDHICIQYLRAKVYRVDWNIINQRPHADVFCDTSRIEQLRKQ